MSAAAGGRVQTCLYRPREPFGHVDENVDTELSDKNHLAGSICTPGETLSRNRALGLGLGLVGEQSHGRAIEADDDRPFGGVGSGFSGHGRLRGRAASSIR